MDGTKELDCFGDARLAMTTDGTCIHPTALQKIAGAAAPASAHVNNAGTFHSQGARA